MTVRMQPLPSPGRHQGASPSLLPIAMLLTAMAGPAQHAWRQIQLPDTRSFSAAVFEPGSSSILQFGGFNEWPLNDTWRWNGLTQAWNRAQTKNAPNPRQGHGLVHDQARNQVVLFGGYDGGYYADTWIWDGSAWYVLSPGHQPGGRSWPGLAYDSHRGRTVLYGGWANGNYGDTWEWTGNDWIDVSPPATASPPGRHRPGMTYDPVSRTTVMFGGYTNAANNQTWSWNGLTQTWLLHAPTVRPSARYDCPLVHDPIRGVIVLYGGHSGTTSLSDTWEWNGATWTQRLVTGPGPRNGHTMSFDTTRGRVVLIGGETQPAAPGVQKRSDVWEWDGTAWTQRHVTSPTGRWSHSMAYHAPGAAANNHLILFGGQWNPSAALLLGDTWLWNGVTWTQPSLTTAPSPRGHSAMAYDSQRAATVLFGGYTTAPNNQTWSWNGTNWQQLAPANSPGARYGHAMAFHAASGQTIVFAGYNAGGLNDTWSWNGTNWTNITPASGNPGVRYYHSVAYDPSPGAGQERVVLFGGQSGSGRYADTWSWTPASSWVPLTPVLSPSGREGHCMAYDPSRGCVVLFSGYDSQSRADTWELRANTWVKCTQPRLPPSRYSMAMAYDSDRQRMIAFGGYERGGDFWESFNAFPASVTPLPGSGCALGANTLDLTPSPGNLPWMGGACQFQLSGVPAFSLAYLVVGFPPAINLPIPGFPGCTGYVNPAGILSMTSATPATSVINLPPMWSYVGMDFLVQGIALNSVQLGLSRASTCRIGIRK